MLLAEEEAAGIKESASKASPSTETWLSETDGGPQKKNPEKAFFHC